MPGCAFWLICAIVATVRQTDDIVTAGWVAERLERPLRTVVRHAKLGKLPHVGKLPGNRGAYLFDRSVIEEIASRLDEAKTAQAAATAIANQAGAA